MRTTGYATTAALGMTELQQMGQLIAVPGMHSDLQRMAGLPRGLDCPAPAISAGTFRRRGLNLLFDGISSLLHSRLYAFVRQCLILVEALHHGIGEAVDRNLRAHRHRLTFWHRNFTLLRL